MTFPSSPTNLQTTTTNGVQYIYYSNIGAWEKVSAGSTQPPVNISSQLTVIGTGGIISQGNIQAQANLNVTTAVYSPAYFYPNGGSLNAIGGTSTQLQFNDAGSFAGTSAITYYKANGSLVSTGSVFANNFSGTAVYAGTIGNTGATITGATITGTTLATTSTITAQGTISAPTLFAGTIGNTGASVTATTVTTGTVTTTGNIGAGKVSPVAFLSLGAGTTTQTPLAFDINGVLNTVATRGAVEYDGVAYYATIDSSSGRGYVETNQLQRIQATGGAIGPGANAFFGAASNATLASNSVYLLEAVLDFLKTTAGTVTFSLNFAQSAQNVNIVYNGSPVGGISTVGTSQFAGIINQSGVTVTLPATGSLTTAVNHSYRLNALIESNASTAGTFYFGVVSSAGTITPSRGSYYKLTRIPSLDVGSFV
jgi:hypothetical protein